MAKIITLKVPLKEIQKTKRLLAAKDLFLRHYEMLKDKKYAYIPIKNTEEVIRIFKEHKIVKKDIKRIFSL